jgi:hypothetical protein
MEVLHLAGERFKMMTGVNILDVPYKGTAPALTDVLGGKVDLMFISLVTGHRSSAGRQPARLLGHERGAAAIVSKSSGDWRDRFGLPVGSLVWGVWAGEASRR